MKSDIIAIDNAGNGFQDVMREAGRTARYMDLSHRDALRLGLMAEEVLSMARSITGEMKASFWFECEGSVAQLHMTTETVMDKSKRALLIASSSSRKNAAAHSFIGRLRDAFEQAIVSDADQHPDLPPELAMDISGIYVDDNEWDGYERSTLRRLADDIRIGVRGRTVEITVSKRFENA